MPAKKYSPLPGAPVFTNCLVLGINMGWATGWIRCKEFTPDPACTYQLLAQTEQLRVTRMLRPGLDPGNHQLIIEDLTPQVRDF